MRSAPRSAQTGIPLLALLGLSSLITALDFSIVYVALPDIATSLGFSPAGLQWVISAYAISFGGLLMLTGRLSDLLGRRRVFLGGMSLFALGSGLGGLADSPWLLIGARVLQGVGAAALFPSTLSLVTTSFAEGTERDRALGIWAAAGAGGLSLGALLGGVLTEAVGWQGVFIVNLPLALAGIIGGLKLLPPDPRRDGRRSEFDLAGALTGTIGATALVFVAAQGPELGWTSPAVLGAALAALASIGSFVATETAAPAPLLPLRLLRSASLTAALGVIFVFGLSLNVVPYALTLFFQSVLGLSPLLAGLGFLAPTAAITAGNLLGERLITRFGVRAILICGSATGALGALALTPAISADGTYLAVLPGLLAFGLGLGVVYPAMFAAASKGVAERDSGIAAGLASAVLQFGTAVGLATLVGIASADLDAGAGPGAVSGGLRDGLYVIAAAAALAIVPALTLGSRSRRSLARSSAGR